MWKAVLSATLCLWALIPLPAHAQRYGSWDVACPLGLSPRFTAPFNHGVMIGGKEFVTEWQSESPATPLPSRNWYIPSWSPDLLSTDGSTLWYDAGILTHCWVYRDPYRTDHHIDVIGYRGSLRVVSGGGSCDEDGFDEPLFTPEPPEIGDATPEACDGSGGSGGGIGGDGDGGTSAWVCIYTWQEGIGWVELWCGWATVVEGQVTLPPEAEALTTFSTREVRAVVPDEQP